MITNTLKVHNTSLGGEGGEREKEAWRLRVIKNKCQPKWNLWFEALSIILSFWLIATLLSGVQSSHCIEYVEHVVYEELNYVWLSDEAGFNNKDNSSLVERNSTNTSTGNSYKLSFPSTFDYKLDNDVER